MPARTRARSCAVSGGSASDFCARARMSPCDVRHTASALPSPMGTLAVTHVAAPAEQDHPPVSLDDKYTQASGRALMSGIQALVRLLLEQRRLDARRGLDTGVVRQRLPGLAARRPRPGARARARAPGPARRRLPAGAQRGARRDRRRRHAAARRAARARPRRRDRLLVRQEPRPRPRRRRDPPRQRQRHRAARRRGRADRRRPGVQVLDAAQLVRAAVPQPADAAARAGDACARSSSSACTPSRSRASPACGPA